MTFEIFQWEKQKEKKKSDESLHNSLDTIKRNSICTMEIPEGEEERKGQKIFLK